MSTELHKKLGSFLRIKNLGS